MERALVGELRLVGTRSAQYSCMSLTWLITSTKPVMFIPLYIICNDIDYKEANQLAKIFFEN